MPYWFTQLPVLTESGRMFHRPNRTCSLAYFARWATRGTNNCRSVLVSRRLAGEGGEQMHVGIDCRRRVGPSFLRWEGLAWP